MWTGSPLSIRTTEAIPRSPTLKLKSVAIHHPFRSNRVALECTIMRIDSQYPNEKELAGLIARLLEEQAHEH
jgi:hypothetical protein